MAQDNRDAIVVGGGHNGLVCAAYLARAGLSVEVVERAERPGGACVTEELFPGFRMSTASYALSLLAPSIVAELRLDLEIRPKDSEAFVPLPDGGGITLWSDPDRKRSEIARVSKPDADAYGSFIDLFEEAAARLRPLLMYPATRKQARRAFRKSEIERLFATTVDGSIAALCEDYFESDPIQGLTASQGIIGSAAGPRTPGTAYIYLHHAFGLGAGSSGAWGFVRGGMGAITEALAGVVRDAGGRIATEAEVSSLLYDRTRRAAGVVLADGTERRAPIVCMAVDPKRVVALVDPANLPQEFVEDVELLPTDGTVVKVNCALGALPKFRGMETSEGPGPEHLGTITIAPSIDYLEASCRAAASGDIPDQIFCEAWIQTASESELAPAGKHTLSIFAQYVPYELGQGSWDTRREEVGDAVVGTLERYAPGLSELIEDRMVLGPPDLEARFGLPGGHIFHGELLPDWLFERRPAAKWHRYRAPIPGVYMCGSGTHGGGGVSGIPGRNGARAILADIASAGSRPVSGAT